MMNSFLLLIDHFLILSLHRLILQFPYITVIKHPLNYSNIRWNIDKIQSFEGGGQRLLVVLLLILSLNILL
ncbi:hypothetical protein C1645_791810 [Glomus cerebriforme]|uniref:Uncharacterized protein n=1 Tax=Glomus cerebriforme TaxID=658196 RepID=A0A397S5P1_9GLOM|nr:hypothetical protein C1645_791810 [Glomus cerebriforme]